MRGLTEIGEGLGTLDREVFEAVAESPSPLLDTTMPRLSWAADHSKLWFVIAAALVATRHPSRCPRRCARSREPGDHQPDHQPVRQARLEAAATQPRLGAAGPTQQAISDVELAAVRTLRKRCCIRRRGGAGEPSGRACVGAACGTGRLVARRRWRALSGRRVRRLRNRRGRRRARGSDRAADYSDEDPRRRSPAGGDAAATRRRGRGAGDQPRVGKRHRFASGRRSPQGAARGGNSRTRRRRRHRGRTARRGRARGGARRRRWRRHRVVRGGHLGGKRPAPCGLPRRNLQPLRQGHRLRHRREDGRRHPARQRGVCGPGVPQRETHRHQHRQHRRLPEVRADPRKAGTQDRQAARRALRDVSHAASRRARTHLPTTTRPCRHRCSSLAIRRICPRASHRRDARGWTTDSSTCASSKPAAG